MTPKPWTEEDDKWVILVGNGMSASQIAAKLGNGRTRNAVIGRLGRLRSARADGRKVGERKPRPPKLHGPPPPAPRKDRPSIIDLRAGECKWPHGHPGEGLYFCGAMIDHPESPYCVVHQATAYRREA